MPVKSGSFERLYDVGATQFCSCLYLTCWNACSHCLVTLTIVMTSGRVFLMISIVFVIAIFWTMTFFFDTCMHQRRVEREVDCRLLNICVPISNWQLIGLKIVQSIQCQCLAIATTTCTSPLHVHVKSASKVVHEIHIEINVYFMQHFDRNLNN